LEIVVTHGGIDFDPHSVANALRQVQLNMDCFGGIYRGKRVLVTGHAGFKGSWLCEWLIALGAKITGCSLPASGEPNLFAQLDLASRMTHLSIDVRDFEAVKRTVDEVRPDFIFHLAAQPLVRLSYAEPVSTFATNVMGTAHVLEAIRLAGGDCTVIAVTSDKCYENKEWVHGYREEDPMGGHDPYSSSKGAAELLVAAYRRSYFSSAQTKVRLASVRAGNVIGGGDWAEDRIVPDCMRALQAGGVIQVRNRHATRSWQHVLEPLSGYLSLAARLSSFTQKEGGGLDTAFNFGPNLTSNRSVADLVKEILKHWPGQWADSTASAAVHEATYLNLATDKAHHLLGWTPVWTFSETVAETVRWYRAFDLSDSNIADMTRSQITAYVDQARRAELSWSR
jgi:CDP-glucose 4,6-dehydratase